MSGTRTLALVGVLVAWTAVSYGNRLLGVMAPALLPTPGEVAKVFVDTVSDGSLPRHVATSLARVGVGFGVAAAVALALGLLAALCVPVRLMLEPIIELVRPIPPLAFLPMFLVWFGLGEASKVAFIGYTTFFPMFVAIAAAVLRVEGPERLVHQDDVRTVGERARDGHALLHAARELDGKLLGVRGEAESHADARQRRADVPGQAAVTHRLAEDGEDLAGRGQ